jgi:hypothetical protein
MRIRMMPELPVFGDREWRRAKSDTDSQAIELRTKIDGLWR